MNLSSQTVIKDGEDSVHRIVHAFGKDGAENDRL